MNRNAGSEGDARERPLRLHAAARRAESQSRRLAAVCDLRRNRHRLARRGRYTDAESGEHVRVRRNSASPHRRHLGTRRSRSRCRWHGVRRHGQQLLGLRRPAARLVAIRAGVREQTGRVSRCAARTRRSTTAQPPRWTSISAPAASRSCRRSPPRPLRPRALPWSAANRETSTCWTAVACRASLDRRPPCSTDSATDASLLAPEPQPHFGKRGPLNVFGPYSDTYGAMDLARGRSVPAIFRDRRTHAACLRDRQHEEGSGVDDERAAVARAAEGDDGAGTPGVAGGGAARTNAASSRIRARRSSRATARRDPVVWVLDHECAPLGIARRRRSAATGSPCARRHDAASRCGAASRDSSIRAANTTSRRSHAGRFS